MKIELIENPDTTLRDARLPQVTSLRAPILMFGFAASLGTISVSFHRGKSVDDRTTPSADIMTLDGQARNNLAKLLLDGAHRL